MCMHTIFAPQHTATRDSAGSAVRLDMGPIHALNFFFLLLIRV